jgi:16S rRNA (cytidine1402-2'-O)-methyltransferase
MPENRAERTKDRIKTYVLVGQPVEPPRLAAGLHLVATPIGNLRDITIRALETLAAADVIACEDSRVTRKLLDHYGITTPLTAYHEHNAAAARPKLMARLSAGEAIALVSDAGTPLISDPGARLVHAAANAGIVVTPVPGASALLAALVASALDATRFTFFGFLTRTGSARRVELDEISRIEHTVVLYESSNRLVDTLGELEERGNGERSVVVAREMTKQFEEVRRGTLSQLRAYYEDRPPRGEIVIVIGGAARTTPSNDVIRERVLALRATGLSAKDAAALVADELGVSKNIAYRLAQSGSTVARRDVGEVDE